MGKELQQARVRHMRTLSPGFGPGAVWISVVTVSEEGGKGEQPIGDALGMSFYVSTSRDLGITLLSFTTLHAFVFFSLYCIWDDLSMRAWYIHRSGPALIIL